MSNTLLVEKRGAIAYITLNRPKAFNSFNREMALALIVALDDCAEDTDIRAIALTGAGRAFCAGQDLQEAIDDNGITFERLLNEHYNPIVKRIRQIEKPIVALVNGIAAGAGANIAFACDLTLAKSSASFTQAFSKIGLIPDSAGSFFLPRLVGMQRASALTMLSEKISAAKAELMGLIYQAVEDEQFEARADHLLYQLVQMPSKGLGLTKRVLNASLHNDLETQLALETELQIEAGQTYDCTEGIRAFLEKRKPKFSKVERKSH